MTTIPTLDGLLQRATRVYPSYANDVRLFMMAGGSDLLTDSKLDNRTRHEVLGAFQDLSTALGVMPDDGFRCRPPAPDPTDAPLGERLHADTRLEQFIFKGMLALGLGLMTFPPSAEAGEIAEELGQAYHQFVGRFAEGEDSQEEHETKAHGGGPCPAFHMTVVEVEFIDLSDLNEL